MQLVAEMIQWKIGIYIYILQTTVVGDRQLKY